MFYYSLLGLKFNLEIYFVGSLAITRTVLFYLPAEMVVCLRQRKPWYNAITEVRLDQLFARERTSRVSQKMETDRDN